MVTYAQKKRPGAHRAVSPLRGETVRGLGTQIGGDSGGSDGEYPAGGTDRTNRAGVPKKILEEEACF
jgi:hypothetical protein